MKSDNEWLNSPPQVLSVTISKFPTAADFLIEIWGFKMDRLFDKGAKVSCTFYNCYRELTPKTKINTNIKAKVSSA